MITKEKYVSGGLTVEEVFREWLTDGKGVWKKSTYAIYRSVCEKHILPAMGHRQLQELSEGDCSSFLTGVLESGLSVSQQNQIKNIFTQGLEFGAGRFGTAVPRLARRRRKKKQVRLELPERQAVSRLLRYTQENSKNETCLGILLCIYTGIRIGELCALQWKDIDLKEGCIHISKTMQRIRTFEDAHCTEIVVDEPKSLNSNRIIPIPGQLMPYLLQNRKGPEHYVVKGKRKAYAEPRTIQYRFQKILEELELPYFNFHQLRHIFASNCIQCGFDVKSTSQLLGHSDIYLTMNRYVHSDAARMKKLMDTFVLQ